VRDDLISLIFYFIIFVGISSFLLQHTHIYINITVIFLSYIYIYIYNNNNNIQALQLADDQGLLHHMIANLRSLLGL
jgi:hypothetical protein